MQADLPFYHITPTANLSSIYAKGLLRMDNPFGICVSRSKHPLIVKYIVEMMLNNTEEIDFTILEIIPSKHNIQPIQVINDDVEEASNPTHNYITKSKIHIRPEHIVDTYKSDKLEIFDKLKAEEELKAKGLIWNLNIK